MIAFCYFFFQVLLYNGQLDIIVGAPLTENFMRQLKWLGQSDYLDSQKTVWKLNGTTVGYVRQVGSFQQVREGGREGKGGERGRGEGGGRREGERDGGKERREKGKREGREGGREGERDGGRERGG